MKNFINKGIVIISSAALVLTVSSVIWAAEPGSSSDPLITLSYFSEQIEELKEDLESQIEKIKKTDTNTKEDTSKEDEETVTTPISTSFKIVNLKENHSLICGEGTELIVRSGESKAIASASGGLSDVTEGRDLSNGEIIKNNHHLIVPRNDGRGITAVVGGAIMVKGEYEIKENE